MRICEMAPGEEGWDLLSWSISLGCHVWWLILYLFSSQIHQLVRVSWEAVLLGGWSADDFVLHSVAVMSISNSWLFGAQGPNVIISYWLEILLCFLIWGLAEEMRHTELWGRQGHLEGLAKMSFEVLPSTGVTLLPLLPLRPPSPSPASTPGVLSNVKGSIIFTLTNATTKLCL